MRPPSDRLYSVHHVWWMPDGRLGVTDRITRALRRVERIHWISRERVNLGVGLVELEDHKGVLEVLSPVDGDVTEINAELVDRPHLLHDCYGAGWLLRVVGRRLPDLLVPLESYDLNGGEPPVKLPVT